MKDDENVIRQIGKPGVPFRIRLRAVSVSVSWLEGNMAARVIHFGVDDCYRLKVLSRAGYEIDACSGVNQLRAVLDSPSDADAVIVNDSDGSVPLQVISVVRFRTSAPIVLFPDSGRTYETDEIDLVVPSFTPPEKWLLDLANLIVHSRAVRAYSHLLRQQSELLCQESAAVCETAIQKVQRSRELLADQRSSSPRQKQNPEQT